VVLEVTGNAWEIARILEPHVVQSTRVPRANRDSRADLPVLASSLEEHGDRRRIRSAASGQAAVSLNRETELRIAGLEWQEFEQLVFDLAFAQHPGAVKTTPPDLGADTLVFDDGEHGRHVFQAKNYRERIRWDACVESR
jgi:hypothetical protein